MQKRYLMIDGKNRKVRIAVLALMPLLLLLALNYRQLYPGWAIASETKRLANLAENAPEQFQNPAPVEDRFEGQLSPDFWEFSIINGGGNVSNEMAWHSAAMTFDDSLVLQHFPDPFFNAEPPDWHKPASDQYNNISLIGAAGFRPSVSSDIVLKFSARVSEEFYGTAGVVFQPVGTVQKNGFIAKPFDMFGFSVAGSESSIAGIDGPICYLALNWIPAQLVPLQVEPQSLHDYEIRLRWVNRTEWLGIVKVDETTQCQIEMPAFGPVEVHVWTDNYLVLEHPRRWWEIAPAMELQFQDGGNKQFALGSIEIFEEER